MTRVSRVQSLRAWGSSTGPTACALAGRRCSLWGWRKGVPRGGAFHRCEGRLRSGAPPPQTARPLGGPLGSATHVLWAQVCGCGGPTLFPWPACPGGAACRRGGRGPSPGGMACNRCEGRLVSGAVPPPVARPLGRAAGVPRPVCPGCGRCGCGDPALAPQRGPLQAGVARCGGRGRASPGGVPSIVVRGVCGQALPLFRLPALWAGVVPLLIFFNKASINTFLDLALIFLQPVPVERDRDNASLASFQIQVSVSGPSGPVFYKGGEAARRRTPPHRLSAVSSGGGQG